MKNSCRKGVITHILLLVVMLLLLPTACISPVPAPPTRTPEPSPSATAEQPTLTETPATSFTPTVTVTETQTLEPTSTPEPPSPTPTPTLPAVQFPSQADFVDMGTILKAGAKGEWDHLLWGGFVFSVIKWRETYYLYYQGSIDYSAGADETNMWRAIGVATSQDGFHFTKHPGNPIVEWFPNQNLEEGATSSAVTIGEDGSLYLYYGANTQETATTINADIRVSSSQDGFQFTDLGVALWFRDSAVWGSGDELYAVDAIYSQGKWIVYYIPNGSPQRGLLGVAYGDEYNQLVTTSAVTSNGNPVPVWGTAGHVMLSEDTYALITNNIRENRTEVRVASIHSPEILSEPVQSYQLGREQKGLLHLDEERQIWIMYYFDIDRYGVKVAPVGLRDVTPPSEPEALRLTSSGSDLVQIEWNPSTDSETGILLYRVYRNGELIGTASGTQFIDTISGLGGEISYRVSAVNYHGIEGPRDGPELLSPSGD